MGFGLLAGIVAVALVWWLLKQYTKADPHRLAVVLRRGGGALALGVAAILLLRGRFDMAIALGGAGLWLLGYGSFGLGTLFGGAAPAGPAPGGTSQVRTASVEMELDHDSGDLRGRVLAGDYAGLTLDSLDLARLTDLMRWCRDHDPDGGRLLEAYLDRRFPGWREDAHGHADAGPRQETASGAMTKEEAYQILGLGPGASGEEIRKAHRALMKKLHPDQGGSTYLASRVNQAKDILLSQHL